MPKKYDRRIDKSSGKVTGMGVCAYFASLFEANELVGPNRKMTDEMILAKVRAEFPEGKVAKTLSRLNNRQLSSMTVNGIYRYKYNHGVFTRGIPPEKVSFRYDAKGRIADYRKGKQPLLPEEIAKIKKDHEVLRKKLLKEKLA